MPVEQIVSAWSLQFAHPEHIPQSPDQGPITLENAGDRLFLRCERQVSLSPPLLRLAVSSFFCTLACNCGPQSVGADITWCAC